jgi:protein ImuB
VVEANGPERISGEWWMDGARQGFARDYYQITAEGGERLWIFRSGEDFYLHGYFD